MVAPALFPLFLPPSVSLLSLRRIQSALACLALALAGGAPTFAATTGTSFTGPVAAGEMEAPPRNEASGLAASIRSPNVLWTHDDSGGKPVVYAIGTNGKLRGMLRVTGVRNEDWEDLASGEIDGRPCLFVADTGDNESDRASVLIHIVEEPAADQLSPAEETAAAPLATLTIKYEDGPRDCEAVAFAAQERAMYLLSKRDDVPRLYRVLLPAELKSAEVRAHFVGFVPRLPQPLAIQRKIKGPVGRHRGWPTGMDFTADGSVAVVLTYGDVSLFPRRKGESWADALSRDPVLLPSHVLPQAEGICFSRDGAHLFVASELTRVLERYDRR